MILKVGDKMKEDQKKKRNLIAKISGIFLGLVLVLGISYAIFRTSDIAEKTNRINTADFNVEIQNEGENAITMENAAPMKALEGQKQAPYTFDVVNTGTLPANYTLYLEVPNTSTLSADNIKYSLVRTDTEEILSFFINSDKASESGDTAEEGEALFTSTLLGLRPTNKEDNKILYTIDTGVIGPGQRQSYQLNMWVSYESGVEVTNKNFEAKARVDAEQVSADEAYPIKVIRADKNQYLWASLYSDYSLRFNGWMAILTSEVFRNNDVIFLTSNIESMMERINEVFVKYDYEAFSTWDEFILWTSSEEANTAPESLKEEVNGIVSDVSYPFFNGSIYYGDGIIQIASTHDSDPVLNGAPIAPYVEKIYISESVGKIDGGYAFKDAENLKEIYFTKVENPNIQTNDLTISSGSISGNEYMTPKIEKIEFGDNLKVLKQGALTNLANLTALTLPASVTTIESGAIQNCPNLDLKILAKKSTIANSDFLNLGVKSITWVNN